MSLVLRRTPGQKIVIGDGEVIITFHRFVNGIATFGVEAPKSIPVNRLEIYEKQINEKSKHDGLFAKK